MVKIFKHRTMNATLQEVLTLLSWIVSKYAPCLVTWPILEKMQNPEAKS